MPLPAPAMPATTSPGWEVARGSYRRARSHAERPAAATRQMPPPSDEEPDAHREDADDDVEEGAHTSADQAGLGHPLSPGARVRLADSLDSEHDRQHNLCQREKAPPAEHDAGDAQDHAGQRQAVLCLRWDLGIARCVLLRGLVCPVLRLGTVLLDGICLGSRVRRPGAVLLAGVCALPWVFWPVGHRWLLLLILSRLRGRLPARKKPMGRTFGRFDVRGQLPVYRRAAGRCAEPGC